MNFGFRSSKFGFFHIPSFVRHHESDDGSLQVHFQNHAVAGRENIFGIV